MVDYDVKDITIEVDGVTITQLAEGGDTGITPDDAIKDTMIEALDGEKGWNKSPNTMGSGTIEVLKSCPQVPFLIGLVTGKKDVKVSMTSVNKEATGFSEISLAHAKIGHPEAKVTRTMDTFAFSFDGYGFDFDA